MGRFFLQNRHGLITPSRCDRTRSVRPASFPSSSPFPSILLEPLNRRSPSRKSCRRAAMSMSSRTSSSRCALRHSAPPVPLILCPDCDRQVKQGHSGMEEHPGWIYFKCRKHGFGCNFWHWELEYVQFLEEHNYIAGEAAIEAVCWAQERREELELRKQEASMARVQENEMHMINIRKELKQMVVLLKIAVGVMVLMCAMCVVLLIKK